MRTPECRACPRGQPVTLRRLTTTTTTGTAVLTKLARGLGWTLVTAGVLVLLFVVYLMFFTSLETRRAQGDLLESWNLEVGAVEQAERARTPAVEPVEYDVDPGDAYAALWFERGGERIVHDETLLVVEGVAPEDLKKGPGHYPGTSAPGGPGNFALSGHRTTYLAPFYHADKLQPGDEVHVVDRGGQEWIYDVVESRVVAPRDVWVIEEDPLGTGRPLLTLTTCHPRFSAAQRLIVFAELRA